MKSYFGTFSSQSLQAVDCTVLVFDKNISIGYKSQDGSNAMLNWLIRDISADVDVSRQCTKVRHHRYPGELLIEGKDAALYIQNMQAERLKPWYRKSSGKEWIRNGLLFLGIIGLLVMLYLLIVPWLSQKLASKVSVKTEQQLGDAVYDALGLAEKEDKESSLILNDFFQAMKVPSAYTIRISVVNDNVVNAFALPGGRIVVYKALLQQVSSYPELAALLSHEFVHINNKHSTKRIFRALGSKIFLGLLFGRFGSVAGVMIDHADDLKNLSYSRNLEKEADIEGLNILLQRKIDSRGFEDLFTHLKQSAPGTVLPEFLASHPDIDKRIQYIKKASNAITFVENETLKAIFEKLK